MFRTSVLVVLLSLAPVLSAFQDKPGDAKPKGEDGKTKIEDAKKASIEGVVVDAVTGKPVKDASLLVVSSTGAGISGSTKADEDGKFLFKNLDPGSFLLIADHPRYARQTYGSRNGLLGGTMLSLSIGQSLTNLSFKLQPNAIASGRVLDEDGDPVNGAMVAALKPMYVRGKRQFLPVGTGVSNDLGEFRIANLASGRYMLVALIMNPATAVTKTAEGTENVYIPTYYPNMTDTVGAGQVEISAGRDVGGLDIRMAKAKSVRIKGRVMGLAENQKASVQLVPKGVGLLAMLTSRSAVVKIPEGTFEITGASAGSYTLRPIDPSGMMKAMGAGVPVEVGERAIDGVMVDVTPAIDLSGVVSMKGDSKESVKGARVILEAIEGLVIQPPMTTAAEDGTFTIKGVMPDKYYVRVMGGPAGSYVDTVTIGNQPIPEDGLPLSSSNVGKLEIKLNPAGANVDGVVRGADDNPLAGVTVALIPASRKYLLYQTTFTDQNGSFSFKGVTPGEYKALAWEEIEPNAFQDPEFLKPFESKGEKASLKESGRQAVSLKAIPRGAQ